MRRQPPPILCWDAFVNCGLILFMVFTVEGVSSLPDSTPRRINLQKKKSLKLPGLKEG
jgi:hypothetical protein